MVAYNYNFHEQNVRISNIYTSFTYLIIVLIVFKYIAFYTQYNITIFLHYGKLLFAVVLFTYKDLQGFNFDLISILSYTFE